MNRHFASIYISCTIFLVFSTIAIVSYQGSNAFISSIHSYQFTQNFLSDLGITHTYAHTVNPLIVRILFAASLISAGCAGVLFFKQKSKEVSLQAKSKLTWYSYGFALCVTSIGLIPDDLYTWPHRIALLGSVFFLALSCGTLAFNLARPTIFGRIFRIFTLLILMYPFWLIFAPLPETGIAAHTAHVILQKCIVYGFLLTVMLCTAPKLQTPLSLHNLSSHKKNENPEILS